MNKGQLTKERIIKKAAELFNSRGYNGSSMTELMKITGLKKGGIYNHFQNKEEIAVEAFKYSMKLLTNKLHDFMKNENTPGGQLNAILDFYQTYPLKPLVTGGCPILNTSVDADNTNILLLQKVQKALTNVLNNLAGIIDRGKELGEFNESVDSHDAAVVITTALQGGIMATRTYHDDKYMKIVLKQLKDFVDTKIMK